MPKCAFVGRYAPTTKHLSLASEAGFNLEYVGNFSGFDTPLIDDDLFAANMHCQAIASDDPMICLEAISRGFSVLIFRHVGAGDMVGLRPGADGLMVVTPDAECPITGKWFGAKQFEPMMGFGESKRS